MKRIFGILIILSFLIISCEDKDVIEIIPNYDEIYLPLSEVDDAPQLIEGDEKTLSDKINAEVKKSGLKDIKIDYKLLIDESGNVNKVEVIRSPDKKYTDLAVKEFKNWKFSPGEKDGKVVKSQYRWYFNLKSSNVDLNEINKEEFAIFADIMPDPIGGLKAIREKIIYPEIAKRAGIEGRVYVLALIDEEGNVVKADIIKGIGSGMDEAAIKAVRETKFTPARHKGKNVKVQITVPIEFKLN